LLQDEIKQAPPSAWKVAPRVIKTSESSSKTSESSSNPNAGAVSSCAHSTLLSALDHSVGSKAACLVGTEPGTSAGSVALGPAMKSSDMTACTTATDVSNTTSCVSYLGSFGGIITSTSLPNVLQLDRRPPSQSCQSASAPSSSLSLTASAVGGKTLILLSAKLYKCTVDSNSRRF